METAVFTATTLLLPPSAQLLPFPEVFGKTTLNQDTTTLPPQCRIHKPDLHLHNLSPAEEEQIHYVQKMDALYDTLIADPDDQPWNIAEVTNHCITKQKGIKRIIVQTNWYNDDNPTWEPMNAICLQQPEILAIYAATRNLTKHPDWSWTLPFSQNPCNTDKLAWALTTTIQKEQKYKFGVAVPKFIAHALYLD